jgi:adenylate cyclase
MSDPMSVSRRLVAVFAADVEGYSRLMGADEVGTLKGLTERRAILDRIIGEHRGRIANTAGRQCPSGVRKRCGCCAVRGGSTDCLG